ncbi:uncharacterized protein LOC141605575 isoform X2 [Silene latifolia]|uniref:uncharacterized protein LOC141605575 isoform X2 n=1 Tax=Silene latifolia TaxID=37657 RepID=UPI003D77CC21
MRFKVGSMVEVLTKKKTPSGVWRCAEIVADNGDGYTVRYYRCTDIVKEGVDKVSVEAVRPRPSPLRVIDSVDWAVGDIVEVLDNGYWKVSVIEDVLGQDCYQIRVVGSIDEFRVKKANIRMRQEWKDDQWILLGKDSGECEDLIIRARKNGRMQQQLQQDNVINAQLVTEKSLQSVKRSFSDISSSEEAYSECLRKRRSVNKETELYFIDDDSYSFIGNTDSHGNIKANLGNKNLQILTMEGTDFSNAGRRNHGDALFLARSSNSKDCVSGLSSVASCSVIDPLSDRMLSHASTSCSQEADSLCSDADSISLLGYEEGKSVGPAKARVPYCRSLKMISWLTTSSLASGKGHNCALSSLQITDKPICI